MIYAYDEILMPGAADLLGRMTDFTVHSLHYDINTAADLFIASGVASDFGTGDIKIICGMSGIELAYEVLDRSGLTYERTTPRHTRSLSSEYWCGYALARIQWQTCLEFDEVLDRIDLSVLISEYSKLRLALLESLPLDITDAGKISMLKRNGEEFVESVCEDFINQGHDPGSDSRSIRGSHLKKIRIRNGLSQSGLAAASGIPVRTIQQYEQGQKDISKARAEYILALARVLNCRPSSLI